MTTRSAGQQVYALAAGILALAAAAASFVPAISGGDLYWHLASGDYIGKHGEIPSTDPFSFTAHNEWMNHEWLWDWLASAAFSAHPDVLAWLNFGVVLLIFGLVYAQALRASASPLAAGLATYGAAHAAHWYLDIRPHVMTLLFVATFMLIRDRRRLLLAWPLVTLLWCNMHAGFVFGVGMLGLHALVTSWVRWRTPAELHASQAARAPWWEPWALVVASVAAMLCNPWGYRLLAFPLSYSPGQGQSLYVQRGVEWQPLDFDFSDLALGLPHFATTFRGAFLLIAVLALPAALARAKRDPYPLLMLGVTAALVLSARRFLPLFAVVNAPSVATTLAMLGALPALRTLRDRVAPRARAALGASLAVLAVAFVLLQWRDTRLTPRLFERWTSEDTFPSAGARYLRALVPHLGPRPRVLNEYAWGGFLMRRVPEARLFIDGRADTVYDEALYRDYLALLAGANDTANILARYAPDAVLVEHVPLIDRLLALPEPWVLVYSDAICALLLPPNSPALRAGLPEPALLLGDEPEFLRRQAARAAQERRTDDALQLLQRALQRDPLVISVYADVLAIVLAQGRLDAAEAIVSTACSELPTRCATLRYALAQSHEHHGHLREALALYREVVPTGPYNDPSVVRASILRVQHKLRPQR